MILLNNNQLICCPLNPDYEKEEETEWRNAKGEKRKKDGQTETAEDTWTEVWWTLHAVQVCRGVWIKIYNVCGSEACMLCWPIGSWTKNGFCDQHSFSEIHSNKSLKLSPPTYTQSLQPSQQNSPFPHLSCDSFVQQTPWPTGLMKNTFLNKWGKIWEILLHWDPSAPLRMWGQQRNSQMGIWTSSSQATKGRKQEAALNVWNRFLSLREKTEAAGVPVTFFMIC